MRTTQISLVVVLIFLVKFLPSPAVGADTFKLQSTYLGNGEFQYEFTIFNDPWIADFERVTLLAFTNICTSFHLAGWSNSNNHAEWDYINSPVSLPLTATFRASSTSTNYSIAPATVMMTFTLQDFELGVPYITANIAGVISLDVLAPSVSAPTSDIPTSLTSTVEFHEDITITSVLVTNNSIHGVAFEYDDDCTVLIQGSQNLRTWTNISYALGYAGSTTWTSSVPIEAQGPFYRIRYYSHEHHPELIE